MAPLGLEEEADQRVIARAFLRPEVIGEAGVEVGEHRADLVSRRHQAAGQLIGQGPEPRVYLARHLEEPRLRRGSLADVILFHWDGPGSPLEMVATVAQGDLRYGEIPELALA